MINFELRDIGLEVKVSNSNYKIEIMKNGLIIGILSGKNSSAGGGGGPAPVNTIIPVIDNSSPIVGNTLTTTTGTWDNSPTSFAYQWRRNGSPILDGTGINSTYIVVEADYNLPITVTITATSVNGSDSATSSATSNVIPLPPVSTAIPFITGIASSGNTLTCSTGTWSSQGTPTYAYQWTRDGVDIVGEIISTYDVEISDEDHFIGCYVIATNTGGSSDESIAIDIYITDPSLSNITTNHIYIGSDKMTIYTPPGYSNNTDNYPIIMFGHGDGERGNPTDATYNVGSGNGSQTAWSGNMTNSNRIVHTSVILTVNGVQVATGRFGVISGTGVTGTYDYDDASNSAFNLTFTSPVTNGHAIVISYTRSAILGQGPFKYCNLGDEPNCIIVCLHISAGSGGYTLAMFNGAKNYLIDNEYRINWNRVGLTGLSLGAGLAGVVLLEAPTEFSAFVQCAGGTTGIPNGANAIWTTIANKGKMWIQGSSDASGVGFGATSAMANNNGADRPMPCESMFYWGIGHSSALWDTKCYNRKNRTDAIGTADTDYIDDFLLKFSSDSEEQATLFTRYAENSLVHEDYRKAKYQVDNLTAGAVKTTLLADLVILKTSIGNAIIVDFGNSTRATTTAYVNNLTSAVVGATAKAFGSTTITNLKDDENNSTGITLTLTAATDTSPSMIDDIGSSRVNGRAHGFEMYTNRDGMRVDIIGTVGQLTWGGLNNSSTYTLRIYAGASNSTFSSRAELEAIFGGITKYRYVDINNVLFIEYNGLTPTSLQIIGTIAQRLTANTERLNYIQAAELILEI